jgi:release factor glutamine methyltransferase
MDRLELINRERDLADPAALARLRELGERRLRGEPVSRILGEKDFYGLSFTLNEATLVPRPETELLVMRALTLLDGRPRRRLLDLGTGTGCVALAILSASPSTTAVAVDLSARALEAVAANAERHGVARRLEARVGSWFEPLKPREKFDVIVSNPPYIVAEVIPTLAEEVKGHDPLLALDGGTDGLDAYREIVAGAPRWLKPGGALVVEIGHDQAEAVRRLFRDSGFIDVVVEKDLAGLDRVVAGHHS